MTERRELRVMEVPFSWPGMFFQGAHWYDKHTQYTMQHLRPDPASHPSLLDAGAETRVRKSASFPPLKRRQQIGLVSEKAGDHQSTYLQRSEQASQRTGIIGV